MKKIFNTSFYMLFYMSFYVILGSITLISLSWVVSAKTDKVYELQKHEALDDFDIKWALKNITNLKTSVEQITQELYSLDDVERDKDSSLTEKYREVRAEIVKVIENINNTTKKVARLLKKVSAYKKQIYIYQKETKEIKADMKKIKKYLQIFTNFLYKLDNNLYGSNTSAQIDEIKLLILSKSIPQSLSNDYLVRSMILQFNNLMEKLSEEEIKKSNLIQRLNKLKIVWLKQIESYNDELDMLKQKRDYLIDFIDLYKNNNFQVRWWLSQLYNSVKDVYVSIAWYLSDINANLLTLGFDAKDKMKEVIEIEKDYKDLHPFSRPLYPISYIHRYFDDMSFEKQYWVPHNWIQIWIPQLTPVYAARNWVVYHVINKEWIGINRVLMAHTEWYVSTYLYLNKINVKVWDVLRKWQLIWYSGWEQWTRWAGFISKWSNLTFWVYKNWRAIDPLRLLDLSVIQNKDLLEWKYEIKYLKDKYSRWIDITEIKFMTGKTLLNRADNFLRLYGKWIYSELAFWEDVVSNTNIDRDVLICVAFAESTLGNYLSTDNNIWNVWNNDRWDRVPFGSALAGARAIADTLNNQYLWHYHTINQLSRYWNKDGNIYASSVINRQKNVTTCLSEIKGFYVPEDYPFRTWKNPNIKTDILQTGSLATSYISH